MANLSHTTAIEKLFFSYVKIDKTLTALVAYLSNEKTHTCKQNHNYNFAKKYYVIEYLGLYVLTLCCTVGLVHKFLRK